MKKATVGLIIVKLSLLSGAAALILAVYYDQKEAAIFFVLLAMFLFLYGAYVVHKYFIVGEKLPELYKVKQPWEEQDNINKE